MNLKQYKNLIILFFTYFLACINWQFINSLMVIYGKEVLSVNSFAIASVGSLVGIVGIIIRPFSGFISEKINAKKLYIVSLVLLSLVAFGYGLSTNLNEIAILQVIRAVSWTFLNLSGQYMVGKMFVDRNLGRAVTIFMLGSSLANIISGIPVLAITNRYGFSTAFLTAAIISAISTVLALFIEYESCLKEKCRKGISLKNFISIDAIPIAAISFVFQIMMLAYGNGFVFDFARNELSLKNIGIFSTVLSISGLVGKFISAEIYDKKGFYFIIVWFTLAYMAVSGIMINADNIANIIIAALILGLFTSGTSAVLQAEAVKKCKKHIGVATNTRSIGNDLGFIFGNLIIAAIKDGAGSYRNSYKVMLLINSVMFFVILIILCRKYKEFFNKNIKKGGKEY